MKELLKSFGMSSLLHTALIVAMLGGWNIPGCGRGGDQASEQRGNKNTPNEVEVEIVMRKPEAPVEEPSPEEAAMAELKKRAPHVDRECGTSHYGGVGVYVREFSQTIYGRGALVIRSVEGYPAHKAGVRGGDYIVNSENLRGEVGTEVTIELTDYHESEIRLLTVYRDKICTETK